MRDKNEATFRGEGKTRMYDHGLSRRSLRVNLSKLLRVVLGWRVCVIHADLSTHLRRAQTVSVLRERL